MTGDTGTEPEPETQNEPDDIDILYIQQPTIDRLLAQQRLTPYTTDDVVRPDLWIFSDNDPLYPARVAKASPEIMFNSVHRRRWDIYGERFIFEYIGDV